MSVWIAPHGMTLLTPAVLYSGWKLNGVPEQSAAEVVWKPLAADACMYPLWPVLRSRTRTSKALPPPGAGASNMRNRIVSPGFMSSVWRLGTSLASVCSCGDGGPVGTPFFWMNPKFSGSSQSGLHCANPSVHSALSIVSAAHHCLSLQLSLSANGGLPGG